MKSKFFKLMPFLVLMCLLFFPEHSAKSQDKRAFGNNFLFEGKSTNLRSLIRQQMRFEVSDTALFRAIRDLNKYSFENRWDKNGSLIKDKDDSTYRKSDIGITLKNEAKSPLMLGVKLNPDLTDYLGAEVVSISKTYPSYTISDSSDAILVGLGITPENVGDFQYRVVENDSIEVITWSPIPKMEKKYGAKSPYAFLGKFNAPGRQLLVEVINRKNYSIRDGVIFDWSVNYRPVIDQIVVNSPKGYYNLRYSKLNHNYAVKFDSLTSMPLDLKFPVDIITSFRVYFKSHSTIPYVVYLKKITHGKDVITQIDWWIIKDYADFSNHHFKTPGKYEVIIHRAGKLNEYGENNTLRIPFEVTAAGEQKFSAKKVIILGLISFLILLLSSIGYYTYNKQKQIIIIRQKEKMGLQLKSIRSQLNPHFMFNALNSIQNLINKSDIQAANHYLTRFASLTRKVLDIGEQELISLEDEISLLDDYLQMEKLRFGFNYIFKIDDGLNKANIEIPAMLLQSLVENAVKHGVANLKEKGQIELVFKKYNYDLVLSVIDNGRGFQNKENELKYSGLGLKLSNERIALLNKTYTAQHIRMEIVSERTGTKVDIILGNWL